MSLRRLSSPSWLLVIALVASCNSSRSMASSSDSVSGRKVEPTVPAAPVVSADKSVRPDVLLLQFGFRQEAETPEKAVALLKEAVERYVRASVEASKAEVAVQMQHLVETSTGEWQSKSESEGSRHAMTAQGMLRVELPEALDFWGRSQLVAALLRVGHQTRATAQEAKAGLTFTFYAPSAQLRDPEVHRADLMKRWVARARSLATEAQGNERAPLQLAGCAPPGRVEQKSITLEEVALTLAVTCELRVGTAAP
jgi:hypothetical protein